MLSAGTETVCCSLDCDSLLPTTSNTEPEATANGNFRRMASAMCMQPRLQSLRTAKHLLELLPLILPLPLFHWQVSRTSPPSKEKAKLRIIGCKQRLFQIGGHHRCPQLYELGVYHDRYSEAAPKAALPVTTPRSQCSLCTETVGPVG